MLFREAQVAPSEDRRESNLTQSLWRVCYPLTLLLPLVLSRPAGSTLKSLPIELVPNLVMRQKNWLPLVAAPRDPCCWLSDVPAE